MSAVLRAVYSCVCCPCVTVGCASPYDEAVQEANELYEATSTATANALKDNRTAALAAGATAVAVAAVAAPVAVMVAGGLFAAGAVATGNVDRVMQFLNVNPRNIPVEKPVENVKDDYDWRDDHNDDLPDLPPPPCHCRYSSERSELLLLADRAIFLIKLHAQQLVVGRTASTRPNEGRHGS